MDSQRHARFLIECAFRDSVDRDVELIAEQSCRERGHLNALTLVRQSDPVISDMIWARFGPFDWNDVGFVYDGAYGHSSRFLWAKVDLTVAWACAGGHVTPDVEGTLYAAVRKLQALWREWAGWMATTDDDLAPAVSVDVRSGTGD